MTSPHVRHYIFLVLLTFITWAALFLTGRLFPLLIPPNTSVLLVAGFAVISLSAFLIFFSGIKKDYERSVFHTLMALGFKMLFSFVFAMLFFLIFKNRETASVILFFVLYLEFTLYVIFTFLSVLKNKSV